MEPPSIKDKISKLEYLNRCILRNIEDFKDTANLLEIEVEDKVNSICTKYYPLYTFNWMISFKLYHSITNWIPHITLLSISPNKNSINQSNFRKDDLDYLIKLIKEEIHIDVLIYCNY